MAVELSPGCYQEQIVPSLLHVRILRASNIPWADWMSNADCYVQVWLPSCSNEKFQTKTASNSNAPEWDETFTFMICGGVKNILHLELHDEDLITHNDLLYTVRFDVEKVLPGTTLSESFKLNAEGKETLEVEFKMQKITAQPEKLLTNKVVVSREVRCLDVCVEKQKIPENLQGKKLLLMVEESCEKNHKIALNQNNHPNLDEIRTFHYIRKWDPELTVCLEGSGNNKEDLDGLLKVPLDSLSVGHQEKVEFQPSQHGRSSRISSSQNERIPGCWTALSRGARRNLSLWRRKDKPLEMILKTKPCKDKLDIRLGFELCDDEKAFLSKRSKVAAAALKKVLNLDRDLQEHEVPVVAVTTTGGGVRAMTSLYGTLLGLKKLNLLDCVSYITGASGSTWAISKLYEDPDWSQKDLALPIEDARRNVTKSKTSAFSFDRLSFYREEIMKRAEQGHKTSFTDVWGLMIESMYHDKVNETKLSDQRKALSNGQNPLPLCLAMNVKCVENTTLGFKEWCEFSPYEVGLIKYGAYIRSEDFGSKFFMGRLTKKLPESRICYLQGLWSNVFSVNLMDAWYAAVSSEHFWSRFTRDNIQDLDGEEALRRKRASSHLPTRLHQPEDKFSETVRNIITNRPLDGEHHNFLRGLQLYKDYDTHKGFCLFQDTNLDKSPNELTPCTEELCLVDSAYYINASFPPLLREERKVDIILSFDYGLSGKFNSVERTKEYCTAQKIPFPKINLSKEEAEQPNECYMFADSADPEAPIILHFPLVNDTFKKFKAPGVKRTSEEMEQGIVNLSGMWNPYSLLKLTYEKEDFNKLLNLTEYNVMNNQEHILTALGEAIARKQKSKPSSAN